MTTKPNKPSQSQIMDALDDIARAAETANYIGQDVCEDFFEAYDPTNEEQMHLMAYEYRRHRAKMWVHHSERRL